MKKIHHSILALTLASLTSFNIANAAPASDKQVYISVGTDVVEQLQKAHPSAIDFKPVNSLKSANGAFKTFTIPESQIAELSELIHQDFFRCPGFFAHKSKQKAQEFHQKSSIAQKQSQVEYTIDNGNTVYSMLNQVSPELLSATVDSLSEFHNRFYTRQSGLQASNWIHENWTSIASQRTDIKVELYEHADWLQPSVMATIEGTESPDEFVVIGGHLDSINSSNSSLGRAPGADDNASGIAVITETLRAIVSGEYKPAKTVVIIGYAAEEVGLRGSLEIAEQFKTDNKNVLGVAQFDMTGYQGNPSTDIMFISDYTDGAQNQFMKLLLDTYMPDINYGTSPCGYACSDHAAWNHVGYPASFPFESSLNQSNPMIHSSSDSEFDSDHAAKFLRLSVAYMAELAKGTSATNLIKGAVTFGETQVSVNEGESVTINVNRVTGQDTQVSIDFATVDGNAVAGTDYTANSGTLTWANQENGSREITIATSEVSEDKTFTVTLSNPQGGVELGTDSSVTITIVDTTVVDPTPTPTPTPEPQAQSSGGGGSFSFFGLGLMLLARLRLRKNK